MAILPTVEKIVSTTSNLTKDVVETPGGKQAKQELGETALTVTQAINTCLLPIAAMNFGAQKAKEYFQTKFSADLKEVTDTIPEDEVKEPRPSFVAPALQGLAFAHEEPDLKKMYLNLLATSMDARKGGYDHPGFVEIIKQISVEESTVLLLVLEAAMQPIFEIRRKFNGSKYVTIQKHIMSYDSVIDGVRQPKEMPDLEGMIDNWVRLGLIQTDYLNYLSTETAYDWCKKRPEYRRALLSDVGESTVDIVKGRLFKTKFGENFYEAVK